jgi:hypothetical protein
MLKYERNLIPTVSIITKDDKATSDKFLTRIFEFGQDLRTAGIPGLGYKKCAWQKRKIRRAASSACREEALRRRSHIFVTCVKNTVTT